MLHPEWGRRPLWHAKRKWRVVNELLIVSAPIVYSQWNIYASISVQSAQLCWIVMPTYRSSESLFSIWVQWLSLLAPLPRWGERPLEREHVSSELGIQLCCLGRHDCGSDKTRRAVGDKSCLTRSGCIAKRLVTVLCLFGFFLFLLGTISDNHSPPGMEDSS